MTNAPETRKTHVIRIVGTNKNGDVLQDIWVDIERIDIVKSQTQTAQGYGQGAQQKLRWMDDPASDDFNPDGNPARKTTIVKVCDVESEADVNDPEEWIPVPAIVGMHMRQGGGAGDGPDDVGMVGRMVNTAENGARVYEVRRIIHHDTNIDAAAQTAFDADPTLTAFVVQGDDYERDDSTADDSQYVEHEIITALKTSGNQGDISGRNGQTKLLNDYQINESEDATLAVTGADGINPPYRLDPFQNIINVTFGLAVEFLDGAN